MAKMSVPILVDWESIKDHLAKSDIVEVIRCKDCKWFNQGYCTKFLIVCLKQIDYCSRAERKEE